MGIELAMTYNSSLVTSINYLSIILIPIEISHYYNYTVTHSVMKISDSASDSAEV